MSEEEVVRWVIYSNDRRHPEWIAEASTGSEQAARARIASFRAEYPHYTYELRKVTTIEERVDE